MNDNYFDLASALVDEAAGHLIGRDDAKSIATAFSVEIEVFADEDYCSIEARNDLGLVAAATAVLRAGGTLQSSIDVFRAGAQMFWATKHPGNDVMFWARNREHYNLTAKAGTDTWVVSTFSADNRFENLAAAVAFIVDNEAAAMLADSVA
jgi:hypothetical protein